MSLFSIAAILITITALFSYMNNRYIRLQKSIGLMFMSLIISIILIVMKELDISIQMQAELFVRKIPFQELLLEGMLGFLLFAGALHVNLEDLLDCKLEVAILATIGVLMSTFLVGGLAYFLSHSMGLDLKPIHCFLFGALISPTDPIAVLGILKKAGAPKRLETKIAGESLFNDGIGVVVFLVIFQVALSDGTGEAMSIVSVFKILLFETVGGLAFGFVIGYIGYRLLKSIDNYQVEIMITLAMVAGGYSLARNIHTSGPLSMVVAGLLIGNQGRRFAMSAKTKGHLDTFWELIDEILNALLFVLIGLEVMVLTHKGDYIAAGLIAIPLVLIARLISIGIPVNIMKRWRVFSPRSVLVMTWGGLRGGISVALALSISADVAGGEENRELILSMTYIIVAFSILIQGLTIKKILPKS